MSSSTSKTDLELYLSHGIDYRRKSMDMVGEIGDATTEGWCRSIRALDRVRPEQELTLYLNSEGGDVYQGLALYDTITACESSVHIHVIGVCMSMAVWVLQAGDKRTASPNSRFMLHVGSFELEDNHQHTNLRWADQFRKDEKILEGMLATATGHTVAKVRKLLAHDTILTTEEAREMGVID